MTSIPHMTTAADARDLALSRRVYESYRILQFAFVVAPILAGADKFFHVLCNWDQYLAPWISRMVGMSSHSFMLVAGVIEIVAGILVAFKPSIFGYVVALWLIGIIVNLCSMGMFYDIALRDLGLAIAAVALARLALNFDHGPIGGLMTRRD